MVNRALTYQQAQSVFKKPTEEVIAVQARKCSQFQQGKRNKNQPPANTTKGKGQPTKKRNVPAVTQRNTSRKTALIRRTFAVSAKLRAILRLLT